MSGLSARALDVLQRAWQEAPALAERELTAATTEATMLLEREVKDRMSVGATGLTRASVTSDVFSSSAGVLGVVGSDQYPATILEYGRRPGKGVSREGQLALGAWARTKLGVAPAQERSVAFLIARKIKARGIEEQQPFARALGDNEQQVVRMFETAADRIAGQLAGGAA